jgi:FAD-dependent urate hydroxylase
LTAPVNHTGKRVLIAGGGLGGISAALGLARAGVEAAVFEEAPEIKEVGTGTGVWLNGMSALRRLGVHEEVIEAAGPVEVQEFRSWRGKLLGRLEVGNFAREQGLPLPVMVRRSELLRVLSERVDPHVLHLASRVVGFEQDGDGVTLRLADGREEGGAALIGADGIDSVVRAGLGVGVGLRYAGYQYLRGLTNFDEAMLPQGLFSFAFGRGDRLGAGYAGGGLTYWFAVIVTPEGSGDPDVGRKGELLERFKDFAPPTTALIESTPEESIYRHDIRDIEPIERWGERRVTLLGDAAHATTPNMGRGAGEAMEDAVALAESLAAASGDRDGGTTAEALRAYERRRREPTAQVQNKAWRIGKLASWKNPLACAVREQIMQRVVLRRMDKSMRAEFAEEVGSGA